MRQTILHLRPSTRDRLLGDSALCGARPGEPEYAEITTAEYVQLFEPRQHVRGRICAACADRFRADLRAHASRTRGG